MKTMPRPPAPRLRFRAHYIPALAALLALDACSKPAPKPETRVVGVVKTERASLENTMTLQAEFEPFQDVRLHGKVSGYIKLIRVDIGDRVKAGDLIATIEVPELGAQLESAAAAQKRAESDHQLAHLDFERLHEVERTQPSLIAHQDIDTASAKDAASEAALAAAKAEAGRYAALVAYTKITAPFAGVITKRFVDVGSLIQGGTSSSSEPIVELAEDDQLRLRFPVPEAETPGIHIGETVAVSVDAVHRKFPGTIARTTGDIDRSTRTMLAEIDVPNDDATLKAGMYASIALPLEDAKNVLVVPLQAISPGEHPSVLVVAPDGTVQERTVAVGLRTSSQAEIRSGLNEGDQVIVSDRGGLHAGDKVAVRELETPRNG